MRLQMSERDQAVTADLCPHSISRRRIACRGMSGKSSGDSASTDTASAAWKRLWIARLARDLSGLPQYAMQRGTGRQQTFFGAEESLSQSAVEHAQAGSVEVWA